MKSSLIGRIIWKEYRQQRALILSVAGLSIILQLAIAGLRIAAGLDFPVEGLFVIALGMPGLYALGCGAMLFASEDESGTIWFLRAIPISRGELLVGKIGFAFLSTWLLMAALWLVTVAITRGTLPAPAVHARIWLVCSVGWIEVLAWSMLCSVLVRRVLVAALLGGCAAALGATCWVFINDYEYVDIDEADIRSLPGHIVIGFTIMLFAIMAGTRWLNEKPLAIRFPRRAPTFAAIRQLVAKELSQWTITRILGRVPPMIATCRHLLWLERRQSVAVRWLLLAATLGSGAFLALGEAGSPRGAQRMLYLLPLLGAVSGTCVFAGDQRRSGFRFFCEHGVSPRFVWLTRQLIWMGWLAIPVLIFTSYVSFQKSSNFQELITVVGQTIVFYCVGQWFSLFLRSPLLAVVATAAGCVVAATWNSLMSEILFSMIWAIGPIPLILLFATWLRMPDWVTQRATWQARLRAAAAVAIPGAVLLASIGIHRATEVPAMALPFDRQAIERGPTESERRTVDGYKEVWRKLQRPTEKERAEGDAVADALRELSEVTRRANCRFTSEELSVTNTDVIPYGVVIMMTEILEREGRLNQDEVLEVYWSLLRMANHLYSQPSHAGRLFARDIENLALERIPTWAARYCESSTQVLELLEQLDLQLNRIEPNWGLAVASEYLEYRRLIELDPATIEENLGKEARSLRYVAWLVSCEQTRMLRLLDLLAEEDLARYDEQWTALANGGAYLEKLSRNRAHRVHQFMRSTPLMGDFHLKRISLLDMLTGESRRRVARIRLALIAWQLDHRELPATLDDLVGHGLDTVPLDPCTGRPFHYAPDGGLVLNRETQEYERGAPTLWTPNGTIDIRTRQESDYWKFGERFPIPIVGQVKTP